MQKSLDLCHPFNKKKKCDVPSIPSWEAVVEMMYDKSLDAFTDEIIKIIYSKDRSMRYVVLKNEKGLLTYQLEAIYRFNEDELKYISSYDKTQPTMWESFREDYRKSLFDDLKELLNEMKAEPEYKQYF